MSAENSRSSFKPGMCAKAWFLAALLACQSASTSMSVALAASTAQTKPSLKAIDPSYAKMDPVPKSGIPSPNPMGAVNGIPISGNQSSGLPSGGYQQYPYQAQGYGQQGYQPNYPPQNQYQGTPGYAGQTYPAQQQGYPAYAAPNQYGAPQPYGQAPQYGGGYGGAPPVQSPPGYPQMQQQQYGNTNQLPPGFVQPGTQQQPQNQNSFPAGRARLGGGHPNLVPQGAPQSAGPGTAGYAGQGSYPQVNTAQPNYGGYQGGYAPSGYQQPAPGGYGQPQGGYSQPAGYTAGGAMAQQFAQTNFPNPNMIPEFGKPLPTDATNKGAGGMWATNQVYPGTAGGGYGGPGGYGGNPGSYNGSPATGAYGDSGGGNYGPSGAVGNAPSSGSPEESRVARLEKVAFGSTYPEHEVEDRVDHLEKEIFGEKSTGDMNSRLQRLEVKLGGSSGSYGSPRSYVNTPPASLGAAPASSGAKSASLSARGLSVEPASLSATAGGLSANAGSLSATASGLSANTGSLSAPSSNAPASTSKTSAKATNAKPTSGKSAVKSGAPSNNAKKLALKQPGDLPAQNSPTPSGSDESSSDQDSTSSPMSEDEDESASPQGNTSTSTEQDSDDAGSSPEPSDTTNGISAPANGEGKSDLKSMAGAGAVSTATSVTGASSSSSLVNKNEKHDSASSSISKTESASKDVSATKNKSALKIPFDKGAGDYVDRITTFVNNTTAHWTRFPVRVRLPEDAPPEWRKLMEPSVEKWNRFIPLKTASRQESADIEVSFVNHLVPRVLGVTRLTVASGQMKVFIYLLRPNYYPQLPEKTLSAAFLHELGHAVGIFGHSEKPTDVMYTFEVSSSGNGKLTQDKLGAVSSRDVNTLKLIYDAEPVPADFNLSAPEEWSLLADSETGS